MSSPPIQLFLTTIASAPVLRQRQEYLLRTLQVKKIPFVSYDLASDPNAKRLWRRKAPKEHQDLPGMLVGGVWPGPFEKFFESAERGDLETFLRMKEEYDPAIDGKVLASQPVGVPGAALPMEMQGHKPSFAPTGPTPMKNAEDLVDAGDVLPGYGFQGLKITMDELTDLAKDLGLNDKKGARSSKETGSSEAGPSQPLPAQDTASPSTSKVEKVEDKASDSAVEETSKPEPEPEESVVTESTDKNTEAEKETAPESVTPLKLSKTTLSEDADAKVEEKQTS